MKDFEHLVQRIESLGLEVNILGDLNCNVESSGNLQPLPIPPADK